jgi:predicted DNA-binding transcriptional regulator AlpA
MGRELLFIEATEAKATRRREILRQQGFTTYMERAIFGEPLERIMHIDEAIFGRVSGPTPEPARRKRVAPVPADRTLPRSALMRLISIPDIAEMLQLSAAHVRDRLVKRADFPSPAICQARMRRWRLEAIERWIRRQEELSQRGS